MKIEIKFTCPNNKKLQYVVGCVSWSSFDPKQTETGLVWKMVNTWPKKFLCDPFSKIGVVDFLISWIFGKKTKK